MATPKVRTGARSWANDIQHACKMSHIPGFNQAVLLIFGPEEGAALLAAWATFCTLVETFIAADDWFAQIDYNPDVSGNEDLGAPA